MPARLTCIKGALRGKSVVIQEKRVSKVRIGGKNSEQPGVEIGYVDTAWTLHAPQPVAVNGVLTRDCTLSTGDLLLLADNTFRFYAADVPRRERRISASHSAVITEVPSSKKGLFKRVGQAFRRKDEQTEKLAVLEAQRQQILIQAGRLSLEQQGGFGLPAGCMASLFAGGTLTIHAHELARVELDHFRFLRERLLFLDTAIAACRSAMGASEESNKILGELHLQKDFEGEEEQAYAAMDDVQTMDQEFDIASESVTIDLSEQEQPVVTPPMAPVAKAPSVDPDSETRKTSSGRRRSAQSARRKRRR